MDYIITADGFMRADTYLAHHGVKGMQWGVRRYQPYGEGYTPTNRQKRKIDKHMAKLNKYDARMRANSENAEIRRQNVDLKKWKDKKKDYMKSEWSEREHLANSKYEMKAQRRIDKIEKIKGNNRYSDSDDYRKAKADRGKMVADNIIYGASGRTKISQLQKTKGYSEKTARAKVAAKRALFVIGTAAVTSLGYNLVREMKGGDPTTLKGFARDTKDFAFANTKGLAIGSAIAALGYGKVRKAKKKQPKVQKG